MQNTLNILCNIKLYLWISIYKYFFNNHNILVIAVKGIWKILLFYI